METIPEKNPSERAYEGAASQAVRGPEGGVNQDVKIINDGMNLGRGRKFSRTSAEAEVSRKKRRLALSDQMGGGRQPVLSVAYGAGRGA